MRLPKLIFSAAVLVLSTAACGDSDSLVYIQDIKPSDPSGFETNSLDTSQDLCLSTTGQDAECNTEPFAESYADIVVVNDNPLSSSGTTNNPLFGRRRFDAFRIVYQTLNGGPELPQINGRINVTMDPGSAATFSLILLNAEAQELFRQSGLAPRLYSVRYTLGGPDLQDVEAAVTVSVGPFDRCPSNSQNIGNLIQLCGP